MRDRPDAAVITWLDEQPAESIWTTSTTVLKVRTGLELLRASALARRATLATRNGRHFEPLGVTVVDPWDEG